VSRAARFVDLTCVSLGPQSRDGRFLGRFDVDALRRELADAGVLAGLAGRGHTAVALRVSAELAEHRLRVVSPAAAVPLVDLRLVEFSGLLRAGAPARVAFEILSFLHVSGLVLQDPTAAFTPERPRLPGQQHPGLGLLGPLVERLMSWAADWGKDGLLVPAASAHVALLARGFVFLDPARQGTLEALRRDLAGRSLAEMAWAVHDDRVVDAATGAVLRWEGAEMAAGVSQDLRGHLGSAAYARARDTAREAARFRVS
jgi:hypothetical protein